MKFIISLLLWAILLVICWPLALLLVFFLPILWLLSIPFRVLGAVVHGLLSLISTIFLLPARLVGFRG